jgi:uncharacterized protein (TIGR00251 family)
MSDLHKVLDEVDGGVVIAVHAQPGAGRTELVGRHGDALKVRVAVPPERGRANEKIAELLAEALGVAAGKVAITGGEKARAKRFTITGGELQDVHDALERALEEAGRRPGG